MLRVLNGIVTRLPCRTSLFALVIAALVVLLAAAGRTAYACQCVEIVSFLASGPPSATVARVRILDRQPAHIDNLVIWSMMGIKPRSRQKELRRLWDSVVQINVVESVTGPKLPRRLRLHIPGDASCGPSHHTAFAKGTEWILWVSRVETKIARKTGVDYVLWAPCGPHALHVEGDNVEGDIGGTRTLSAFKALAHSHGYKGSLKASSKQSN